MVKKLLVLTLAVGLCLTFGLGKANAFMQTADGQPFDLGYFPIYDVRDTAERTDGWQNYLTIQNTSNQWVAAHLRFRTWRKSIEVYDHIILLSPFDVFYIVIERQADGSVELRSSDTATCLNSGLIFPGQTDWSTPLQTYLLEQCGYTAAAGYDLNEELQAGYVELIGLWQLSRTLPGIAQAEDVHTLATVVNDLYNDGSPGNINVFDILEALFWDWNSAAAGPYVGLPAQPDWPFIGPPVHQDAVNNITLIQGLAEDPNWPPAGPGQPRYGLDCPNVLLANMAMGDATTGQYEMANFFGIRDFRTENWRVGGPPLAPGIHRDTHDFGAILFPTDVMSWLPWDRNGLAVGIDPYLNENWATTVGPGTRDGDDLNVDRTGAAVAGMVNLGLGVVQHFNDHWSLDDVERLFDKAAIWYNYFNDAFGAAYQTDVVLTFPTKHYHWFFADWQFWNDSFTGPPPFNTPYVAYPWVPLAPFATLGNYWAAVQGYRSLDAEPDGAPANGSIATRFETVYANGPIEAGVTIWDMDQNTIIGGQVPPGSPWVPVVPQRIPHEVNIISVGAAAGATGIEEATGILDTAYTMGQFSIWGATLQTGTRGGQIGHPLYATVLYDIPEIGVMIFDLNYSGADYRSTMVPWNYEYTFWP